MVINHCFTTNLDGNMSTYINNEEDVVIQNRLEASKKYGFNPNTLHYMYQVHKADVLKVIEGTPNFNEGYDAQITNLKDTPLMVMAADCIPIIMKDPVKGAIAAVHAGRNSTFLKIVVRTVEAMMREYGTDPKDLEVILGPSIGQCCYEVSQELVEIVKTSFGEQFVNGRHIDLQGINKKLLNEIGVNQVEIDKSCTKCGAQNYYSYRKDKHCGRFAGIIWID